MVASVSPDVVHSRRRAKDIPLRIRSRLCEGSTRELDVVRKNSDEVDFIDGNSVDISFDKECSL